jgi:N-acetylmuramoyl-L-alanine amidase
MVFDSIHQWRRFSQAGGLLLMGGLTGTMVLRQFPAVDSRSAKASLSTQGYSRSAQTSASAQGTPNDQIAELYRLYGAAPELSVDALVKSKASVLESDLGMTTALFQAPPQYRMGADRTNFGDRLPRNSEGDPVQNKLLIVLHETTSSASGAVNTALTPHARDEDQVSYHAIIGRDGTILYLVDPRKRAYGAGNSVFRSQAGAETVQTNKRIKSSVNNFAYHISLETPPGGCNPKPKHTGYSSAQYFSLAWLIAHSGVENNRITTHFAIDQMGERQDPRSLEMDILRQSLVLQNIAFVLEAIP